LKVLLEQTPLTLMLTVTALLYCLLSYLENGWPLITGRGANSSSLWPRATDDVMSISMLLAVRPRWLEQALVLASCTRCTNAWVSPPVCCSACIG